MERIEADPAVSKRLYQSVYRCQFSLDCDVAVRRDEDEDRCSGEADIRR